MPRPSEQFRLSPSTWRSDAPPSCNLLDPELLILAGGLAQNNPLLLSAFTENLAQRVTVWQQRKLRVAFSSLGYSAGVLGAAAVASAGLADGAEITHSWS